MRVHDDNGQELDATFSVEEVAGHLSLVMESRGGTADTAKARNVQYIPGMDLLLKRLGQVGFRLIDAALESAPIASLPLEQRRLILRISTYPVELREKDAVELGKELRAAQGNNTTRRVRLYLEEGNTQSPIARSMEELGAWLSKGAPSREQPISTVEGSAFDVASAVNAEDARERLRRAIAVRRGQPRFRRELLKAYGGRCAVSNCDVAETLEAAHILPYRGQHTHHVQNGLLLRADLHTLFDLGLLGIATETWTVLVQPRLSTTQYSHFMGQKVQLPADRAAWPSEEALREHRRQAGFPD
jgi:5-methylcytosine-specific restriction protein A